MGENRSFYGGFYARRGTSLQIASRVLFFNIANIPKEGAMKKIENILGLEIYNRCIMDKFDADFAKALAWTGMRIRKMLDSGESVSVEEEASLLERKIPGDKEEVYRKALRRLAKLRPEYKKYIPKASKRFRRKRLVQPLSDLLKKRIRLACWVEMGNGIPFGALREVLVKDLLLKKGYFYQRDKLRWYDCSGRLVGKNLFEALAHLEKHEPVDRSRLTIKF
jgi:hypothetical protein